MHTTLRKAFLSLACLLFVLPGEANMVRKMDLAEMCQAAGGIVRGVVVDMDKVTVSAGGGEIPAITYYVSVSERLKGQAAAKGEAEKISFTVVNLKVIDMPRLTVGQEYLLLLTAPSSAGLSSMVGLGQGTFKLYGVKNDEMAVNTLNNAGLSKDIHGPVPYRKLAENIRATLK